MAAKMTRKLTKAEVEPMVNRGARAQLRIVAAKARCDATVSLTRAKMAETIAPLELEVAGAESDVVAYLLANKSEFCSKRKKTVSTPVAKYGFRKCTDTVVDDEKVVIDWARKNGYLDVIEERKPKISKAALRKRIEAGEDVPGAHVDSDFEPFWQPDKTLLDEAKKAE